MSMARGHEPDVLRTIAAKVLGFHLANRNQLFEVPPADLSDQPGDQAAWLVRAMMAAAHADGALDVGERNRILAALASAKLSDQLRVVLRSEMDEPQCLETLVRRVADRAQAARFYAVSLIAIDKQGPVSRLFLAYLAERLALPADLVVRLNRRLGMLQDR
jgi:uncharacterized membrane protein YebE (DUF533 family)